MQLRWVQSRLWMPSETYQDGSGTKIVLIIRPEAHLFYRQNPHMVSPQSLRTKSVERKRSQHIQQIPASHESPSLEIRACGPSDPMPYGTFPTTSYQLWSRGTEDEVTQHFTPFPGAQSVERWCRISFLRDIELMGRLGSVQFQ
jgi:hypothetical protein